MDKYNIQPISGASRHKANDLIYHGLQNTINNERKRLDPQKQVAGGNGMAWIDDQGQAIDLLPIMYHRIPG